MPKYVKLKYDDKRLIRATLPFLLVIGVQAALTTVSVGALSDVRAYVAGESLWTKGQKDAIYYLDRYADTGEAEDYRRFREALAIPLGDRAARRALELSPPDLKAARAGFLAGGNAPADVPGMIRLFLYARGVSYFADAVEKWRATDAILDDFERVGAATRASIEIGLRDGVAPERIEQFNDRMTPLARAFSESLGAGSRAVTSAILAGNFAAGALIYALIAWRTRALLRQRRGIARALAAERERAAKTLEEIGEAVLRIDGAGRIRYLNRAAQTLAGIGPEALGDRVVARLPLVDAATGAPLDLVAAVFGARAPRARRCGLVLARGSARIPVTLAHTRVADEAGRPGAVLVLHDMSHEQEMIERLAHLAAHDPLTGLANRREFERALAAALARGGCALMLIDLDHFKQVNDSAGHAAGDALLRHAATLLSAHVRPGDLVARLGGDEFGVVLPDCGRQAAQTIARNLHEALSRGALVWEGRRFGVTASLGVVAAPPGPQDAEAALRAADDACYRAKAAGRNRVEVGEIAPPPGRMAQAG
jgi:diguanylate cyclase (GGDEF)-like protein